MNIFRIKNKFFFSLKNKKDKEPEWSSIIWNCSLEEFKLRTKDLNIKKYHWLLELACIYNKIEIVKYLISIGYTFDKINSSSIMEYANQMLIDNSKVIEYIEKQKLKQKLLAVSTL